MNVTPRRRCLRALAIPPLVLAMPIALAVHNYQPTHRLKVATMAPTTPSPPVIAELVPVANPAAIAARAAAQAHEVALVAQWQVDGAAAKAELDERLARAAAEEAAKAALSGFRQTPPNQDSRIMNHESTSPRLGGSSGGGNVDVSGTWACILDKESSGNWAEKSNPTYRGGLQMGYDEWASMGGTGDPADASPSEQMMRGQMLQSQRGWQPWSTAGMCGVG